MNDFLKKTSLIIRSIKFGIVIRNVTLLLVTGLSILLYSQYTNNDILINQTKNFMNSSNEEAISRIEKNFLQVENILRSISPVVLEILLKKQPDKIYTKVFHSYLKEIDFLTTFLFASEDKYFGAIKKVSSKDFYRYNTAKNLPEGTQFSWRIISNEEGNLDPKKRMEQFFYFDDSVKLLDSEKKEEPDYYPTKRPWYTSDRDKGVSWTNVYLFEVAKIKRPPGITASIGIFNNENVQVGVFGIDLELTNLKKILLDAKTLDGTKLYLIDSANQIISSTEDIVGTIGADEKPKLPLITEDNYSFLKKIMEHQVEDKNSFLSFSNTRFIVQASKIEVGKLKLTLVSSTPEESILTVARIVQKQILYKCLIFLTFSGVFMFLFARRISDIVKRLSLLAQKIERFEPVDGKPVTSSIVELQQLSGAMESMQRSINTFSKYVPKDLVLKLMKDGAESELGGEQKEITLFFSDIEGFTSISEKLKPHELLEQLTDYFTLLTDVIMKRSGTVDKYIGDAIMAFWGAPEKISNHAYLACHTALEVQRILRLKNSDWINLGRLPFMTRIGIHTSPVIVGNIGSKTRFNYTALGDDVNLCARLEGLNKYYGTRIMISQDTYVKVNGDFYVRPLGKVAVKGKKEAIAIYELMGAMKHVDTALLLSPQLLKDYEKYLVAYEYIERRRFASAIEILEDIETKDGPVQFLLKEAKSLMTQELDDSWEGIVNHMTSK